MPPSDRCPRCGADLDDGMGGSRIIGIELGHDRIEMWRCPDCGFEASSRKEFQYDKE